MTGIVVRLRLRVCQGARLPLALGLATDRIGGGHAAVQRSSLAFVKIPTKVTFRFKKDEDYRLNPVNGVWGGATPRGDISVDQFHESHLVPEIVAQEVTPDGELGRELEREPPITLQRTALVGMVLTAEQADSIGGWLQVKAREVRNTTGKKGDGAGDVLTTQ